MRSRRRTTPPSGPAGAAVAADGPARVAEHAAAAVPVLRERLATEPPGRLVPVFAGLVMPLDEYLVTRIVEQVVHLGDLARSVGLPPWDVPSDLEALVLAVGTEVVASATAVPPW